MPPKRMTSAPKFISEESGTGRGNLRTRPRRAEGGPPEPPPAEAIRSSFAVCIFTRAFIIQARGLSKKVGQGLPLSLYFAATEKSLKDLMYHRVGR